MRLLAPLLLVAAASGLHGEQLRLEPIGHPLLLTVEKTGIYSGKKHIFEFPAYQGSVQYNAANVALSTVELTIEAGKFRLLDDWVDEGDRRKIIEHTRSKETLHVDQHPTMRFRSTAVEPAGAGVYRVRGDLEIRGIAKPVMLEVRTSRDGDALLLEGSATFSMKQYGIKPPKAILGLIGTKDEMQLQFKTRAIP